MTAQKIAAIIRAKRTATAATVQRTADTGDQKGEVNMEEMTTRELARLADWLRAQGFSAEQVLDCLHYITGTQPPEK